MIENRAHVNKINTGNQKPPTFFDRSPLHTAANQGVIGCLMPNDIQQEWYLCRVAEGDLGHQCSLKRSTILHWSIAIQEVTVLLIR